MTKLTREQIRTLKVGEKVSLDGIGEKTISKIVLWSGGGGVEFEGSHDSYNLTALFNLNISVESLAKRSRQYC